ncbi:hypothetical protein N1851_013310 [Merluccius polli]|uniref:Reverse transcriptase domain-containing protein n=1 Tax=Merluccius polli TaxID=89951 RepID=A0AA47MVG0_MERPO|nr:hypothetical protein N1851_013310 [Merluccius polli]
MGTGEEEQATELAAITGETGEFEMDLEDKRGTDRGGKTVLFKVTAHSACGQAISDTGGKHETSRFCEDRRWQPLVNMPLLRGVGRFKTATAATAMLPASFLLFENTAPARLLPRPPAACLLPFLPSPRSGVHNQARCPPSVLVVASSMIRHVAMSSGHTFSCPDFCHKHSAETTLLRVTNDILMHADRGEYYIPILLDLTAVFDSIDHAILLDILHNWVGISGVSPWTNPLFIVYMLPLGHLFSCFQDISNHCYADEPQIYFSAKPNNLNQLSSLHYCLLIHVLVNFTHTSILPKNLGIVFNQHMTFDQHDTKLVQSCFLQLRNIAKIRCILFSMDL